MEPQDGDGQAARPQLSAVIPTFNEAGNVGPLLDELVPVLEALGSYEVIFVDDCSTDRTREIVLDARSRNPNVKLVELSRTFGQQGALSAGYDCALGDGVVVLDADLQDPPALIPQMVERWREGYDVVYAIRRKRKEGPILRAGAYVFYRLLRRTSTVDLPADSGDFCLLDREVVLAVRALPESNRFLRTLRAWVGFRQVGIPYERAARHSGTSKYSMRSRVNLAIDGLLASGEIPFRLVAYAGIAALVASVASLVALIASWFTEGATSWLGAPTTLLLLTLGGIQLVALGIIGEQVARSSMEAKRRPPYVVRTSHGTRREPDERSG